MLAENTEGDKKKPQKPWDDNLSGPALNIARSDNRRILVEAGPGTGKTYALQRRVLRLLTVNRVPASSILAVTFTRTAANDLRNELNKLTEGAGDNIHAMTLHSFCFQMLGSENFFDAMRRVPRPLLTASKSTLLGFEAAPLLSDLDNAKFRKDVYKNDTTKSNAVRAMEADWARDQADNPGVYKSSAEKQFQRDVEDWLVFHKAMLIGELIPLALRYLRHNPQLQSTSHIAPGDVLVLSPSRKIGYAIRDRLKEENIQAQSFFHEEALEETETQRAFTLLAIMADATDRVSLRCWLGHGSDTHNRQEYKKLRTMCAQTDTEPLVALKQLRQSREGAKFPRLMERYDALLTALAKLAGKSGKELLDALFPPTAEWASDIRGLAADDLPDQIGAAELHNHLREQITQPSLPVDVAFVRIMSLHKAKGLTARAVAIVGCVNGLIPREWKPDKSTLPNQREHDREQRRVFYVALTRTTEHLLVSGFRHAPKSLARKMNMPPGLDKGAYFAYTASRFLPELGSDLPDATISMDFD